MLPKKMKDNYQNLAVFSPIFMGFLLTFCGKLLYSCFFVIISLQFVHIFFVNIFYFFRFFVSFLFNIYNYTRAGSNLQMFFEVIGNFLSRTLFPLLLIYFSAPPSCRTQFTCEKKPVFAACKDRPFPQLCNCAKNYSSTSDSLTGRFCSRESLAARAINTGCRPSLPPTGTSC